MKFSMPQPAPDAPIRKVPVSVTVCETGSGPDVEPLRLASFEKIHDIGEGTFGILYAVHDPRAGRLVAIKFLKREVLTEEAATLFQREVAILSSVDHETLLGLDGYISLNSLNGGRPAILTDYMRQGSLTDCLTWNGGRRVRQDGMMLRN
jgi:serine/threonine protein kinase